jgi:hypothetical protein
MLAPAMWVVPLLGLSEMGDQQMEDKSGSVSTALVWVCQLGEKTV